MLATDFIAHVICDGELEKMSRNAFVSEDRPRIFNCGADIKVLRLRVISRNKEKTGRILVVNAWRIHESSGTGWFKRLR